MNKIYLKKTKENISNKYNNQINKIIFLNKNSKKKKLKKLKQKII